MIVQAVVILIIILVVANILISVYNNYYPSTGIDEYFDNAKKLQPNVLSLGTYIPKQRQVSSNKESFYMDYASKDYSPSEVETDLADDLVDSSARNVGNADIFAHIDAMFPANSQETSGTKKGINDYDGVGAAIFEMEFEGLSANNTHRHDLKKDRMMPSGNVHTVERDGYSDR
jgi:hypothetical protein